MAIKVRDISGPSTLVYNILFVSHDAITKYDIRLFTLTPEGFTLTVALNRILFSAPIKMLKESSRQNITSLPACLLVVFVPTYTIITNIQALEISREGRFVLLVSHD